MPWTKEGFRWTDSGTYHKIMPPTEEQIAEGTRRRAESRARYDKLVDAQNTGELYEATRIDLVHLLHRRSVGRAMFGLPQEGELDRSVETNLPLDPSKDTPYQAFRRERGLPDTPESAELYDQYAVRS